MSQRITMSEAIAFHNLAFVESRGWLGLDRGDIVQERFDRLVEAAWDLGCIGVSSAEFDQTVREHGFNPDTERGFNVLCLVKSMYERSLGLHRKITNINEEAVL